MDLKTIQKLKCNPSFCVKAFTSLAVTPSGAVLPCCLFEQALRDENKTPYNISKNDVDEIYNSQMMKDIREKMINGKKVDGCRQCYQVEANGGDSQRIYSNEEKIEYADIYDSKHKYRPVILDLKLNNICNIRCRMCQPRDSNQVHNEFKKIVAKEESFKNFSNTSFVDADLGVALDDITTWENHPLFLKSFNSLLPTLRKISVVGGEPLLSEGFYNIMDLCVLNNVARNIFICVTTNLTKVNFQKIQGYQSVFFAFTINISMDATGEAFHYIRYPSNFDVVLKNFKDVYAGRPQNKLLFYQFSPTIQVYNILYVDKVYTLVESLLNEGYQFSETPIHVTFLEFPMHLNIRILPKNVREAAVAKLVEVKKNCPRLMAIEVTKHNLESIITALKNDFHPDSEQLLKNFKFYTDILDKERNQTFASALPELAKLLNEVQSLPPVDFFYKRREQGWKLAGEQKYLEAIALFESAAKDSDDKSVDFREIAWMKLHIRDFEGALLAYQAGLALKPTDPFMLKGLTLTYFALLNIPKCQAALPAAQAANPNDSELIWIEEKLKTM